MRPLAILRRSSIRDIRHGGNGRWESARRRDQNLPAAVKIHRRGFEVFEKAFEFTLHAFHFGAC